jgi:hypothetical protein
MIQAVLTYRSDQAFAERILPRAPRRRPDFLDASCTNPFSKLASINAVTIPQQILRFAPSGKRLNDLLAGPACGGMFGYFEMHDAPAIMGQNNQHKQDSEGGGGNNEKIDGDQVPDMISRATVRSEILRPSFSRSPWILGLPQDGFASAILRTRSRNSLLVPCRPAWCFERRVQYISQTLSDATGRPFLA